MKGFLIFLSSLFLYDSLFPSTRTFALQLLENDEILVYSGVNQTGKRELVSVGHCHNLDDRKNAQRFKVPLVKSVDLRNLPCIQVWQYECCTGDSQQIAKDDDTVLSNLPAQIFPRKSTNSTKFFQPRSFSPCSSGLITSSAPSTISDLFVRLENRIESQCGSPSSASASASSLVNVKSFETENTAVYFSFPVDDERVNWLYQFMDLGWAYVKKVYGRSYGKLYGIFNLMESQGTSSDLKEAFGPATALHSRSSCRNMIRIDLSDQIQTNGDTDKLTRMMSEIVEGSFGGVLGSPSYWITGNGHGNYSYFADIFAYDIYTKFKMDKDAQRIEDEAVKRAKQDKNDSNSVLLPGKNWFTNWFKPIYQEHGNSTFLQRFLKIRRDHFNLDLGDSPFGVKIPVFSEPMNLGEFILFCSGAAKKDLKDKAGAVFGDDGSEAWHDQLYDAGLKYPMVKNEYEE